MERNWSLADHAVAVLGEIDRMLDGVTNEHPYRYPLRRMKDAASKAAFDGLRTAAEIAEAARILREHLDESAKAQKRYRVKLNDTHGPTLNGHWFWLVPADEFAEKALDEVVGPNVKLRGLRGFSRRSPRT